MEVAMSVEVPMTNDAVREEIAFIRRAIEEGRGYATGWSGDMMVWGVLIAAAYLGSYATRRGWWAADPDWLCWGAVALGWIYSLHRVVRRIVAGSAWPPLRPMVQAVRMLWLACGIVLTTLAVAVSLAGEWNQGWYFAVSCGVMGIGFFASAFLFNLGWMRLVAVGWWAGELGVYALRHQLEVLPLSAALMLLLLALPGFVLMRNAGSTAA
jgi:hypothetical protein